MPNHSEQRLGAELHQIAALVGVAVLGGMLASGLLFLVSYYAATTSYRTWSSR